MNDRPHDDALLALLYDELSPAEADALREKLAAESPESLERLSQWQAIRDVVGELPELEPDPQIHYDIIREARRAVDAEDKPAGIWAWLQSLMLTPAFAGVLLVVLAAGLTVRMTTDLEQADDSALAPQTAPSMAGGESPSAAKDAPAAKNESEKVNGTRAVQREKSADAPADAPESEIDPALLLGAEGGLNDDADTMPLVEAKTGAEAGPRAGMIEGVEAPEGAYADGTVGQLGRKREAADRKGAEAETRKPVEATPMALPDVSRKEEKAPAAKPSPAKKRPKALAKKSPPRKAKSKAAPKLDFAGADDMFDGPSPAEDAADKRSAPEPAPARRQDAPQGDQLLGAQTLGDRADEAPAEPAAEAQLDSLPAQPLGNAAAPSEPPAPPAPRTATTQGYAPPPPVVEEADEAAGLAFDAAGAAPQAAEPAPGGAVEAIEDEEESREKRVVQTSSAGEARTRDQNAEVERAEAVGFADDGDDARDSEASRLDRARLLRARGLHREAISEFEAFLADAGDQAGLDRVWFETAESYRAIGQNDRALRLYRLVAGGESSYAARARERIATMTGQNAAPAKNAGQAAPARARPSAAPMEFEAVDAIESKD